MRRLLAVLLVVGSVAACAGGDDDSSAATSTSSTASTSTSSTTTTTAEPSGCTPARPHEPGTATETVRSSDLDRTYLLHVPPSYDGRSPVPVVLDFHGFGSNAAQQLAYSELATLADEEGFVVVAPEGQGPPGHFNLVGVPEGQGDDVVFTNDLLDRLEDELCIDERRIFATGMSNGGGMTAVLACRAADRIAAFVTVALVLQPLCDDRARPVPIMSFHGDADPVVPYNGGQAACCGNPTLPSQPAGVAKWVEANGCDPEPAEEQPSPQVKVQRWSGCDADVEVVFWTIVGGGHTWPGSSFEVERLGLTTQEVSATEEGWKFFQAHPLPD